MDPYPKVYESRRACPTQAYMLVYLRSDMRDKILSPPTDEQIPKPLREFFDRENSIVDDMKRELDVNDECGYVYLLS